MEQSETKIVFGTDGIRQTVGTWPLTVEGIQKIGLGLGKYLNKNSGNSCVIIGRDTRVSGDFLFASLCSGLVAFGVDVYDVGVITTAGIAYLIQQHGLDLGIMISASHNPWTENGIKLIGPDGFKLSDSIEQAIEQDINLGVFNPNTRDYGQIMSKIKWIEEYIQYLISPFKKFPFECLHVIIDCANGAASHIAPHCFEQLGSKVTIIHNTPTGKNINLDSGSEAVREKRGELIPLVLRERASFGVAFDGDADRAILVDENGNLVDGDHLLYIFARYLNSKNELAGKIVITTEMANSGLDSSLFKIGVMTKRTKVGDKYVIRELQSSNYSLGGEQSGHIIIFDDKRTTGDGIYTALFLSLILLNERDCSLNKLAGDLIKLPQVIASAHVIQKPPIEQIDEFVKERERVRSTLGENIVINTRYSGTEPLFRVMIQGTNEHDLMEIARESVRLCRVLQAKAGNNKGWLEVKDCTSGDYIDISQIE